MGDAETFEAEYRRTAYMIDAPGAPIAVHIDEQSADVDTLIDQFGETAWAFITAYNPYSDVRSAEENQQRHVRLLDVVRSRGWMSFPSYGVDHESTWPSEHGLFVIGITRADAITLGRELEQNAIVVGTRANAAELVWCVQHTTQ